MYILLLLLSNDFVVQSDTRHHHKDVQEDQEARRCMSSFIVGTRGCPDTVQLPLQATAKTTFRTIREAVAAKICVFSKAVVIFANAVEVSSYTSELGNEFSVNNFITYELRISTRNTPKTYEELEAHALDFMCCCGCKMNLTVNGKYCTLNCGCTLCLGCADKQEGDHGGSVRSILCPYHQVLTSNDVGFHPRALCGANDFRAEAPLVARHEGPHGVLDKLLISQQCQFPMTVNGTKITCCNTNLFRCRCELPPMCAPCMKRHLERNAEETDFHGARTEAPVPTDELLSRCNNAQHNGSNSALFMSTQSRLLCHLCYNVSISHEDVEAITDESHVKRSTVAVTKATDELTSSIQRLEDAKAAALTQNEKLRTNLSENMKLLDASCEDYVNNTTEQFDTRIRQLETTIAELKADRATGVRAIQDAGKLLKEAFVEKVRSQQASIVSYIQIAERLLHSTREQLAAVVHTARFAPQIIPAANAVVDFSKRFYAEGPTVITIEQCQATCEPYKPLVRIIATTNLSESTDVRYRSVMRSMERNLRRGNILLNPVDTMEVLPGLSLEEVTAKFKAEQEAAAAAARAKATALRRRFRFRLVLRRCRRRSRFRLRLRRRFRFRLVLRRCRRRSRFRTAEAVAKAKAEQEAAAAAARAKANAEAAAKANAAAPVRQSHRNVPPM
ncbi:Hypothetical protein, putative [Bodo saltans]|uniref:Uncharacterized protein n=1 Tax=Bodo saltans TaxID=75058 RepID=A0A0S4KJG8_BODSA|nr:Hypothetical protein, putative [Bodo saltans]|eukprot:CUI14531.1 Hypothetical protein, putative [Bodo saltans]